MRKGAPVTASIQSRSLVEGVLLKKSEHLKRWNRRYFRLVRRAGLVWTKESSLHVVHGVRSLDLANIVVTARPSTLGATGFVVEQRNPPPAGTRVLLQMRAASVEERDSWIGAIQQYVEHAAGDVDSSDGDDGSGISDGDDVVGGGGGGGGGGRAGVTTRAAPQAGGGAESSGDIGGIVGTTDSLHGDSRSSAQPPVPPPAIGPVSELLQVVVSLQLSGLDAAKKRYERPIVTLLVAKDDPAYFAGNCFAGGAGARGTAAKTGAGHTKSSASAPAAVSDSDSDGDGERDRDGAGDSDTSAAGARGTGARRLAELPSNLLVVYGCTEVGPPPTRGQHSQMAVTVKVTCPATATGDAYVNPRLLFRVESCAKADVAGTGRRSNEMVAETSLAALLGLEDDVRAISRSVLEAKSGRGWDATAIAAPASDFGIGGVSYELLGRASSSGGTPEWVASGGVLHAQVELVRILPPSAAYGACEARRYVFPVSWGATVHQVLVVDEGLSEAQSTFPFAAQLLQLLLQERRSACSSVEALKRLCVAARGQQPTQTHNAAASSAQQPWSSAPHSREDAGSSAYTSTPGVRRDIYSSTPSGTTRDFKDEQKSRFLSLPARRNHTASSSSAASAQDRRKRAAAATRTWFEQLVQFHEHRIDALSASLVLARSGRVCDDKSGRECSFKPSTAKKQLDCAYLPTNLHLQQFCASVESRFTSCATRMSTDRRGLNVLQVPQSLGGNSVESLAAGGLGHVATGFHVEPGRWTDTHDLQAPSFAAAQGNRTLYDTISVGAPAAHALGFWSADGSANGQCGVVHMAELLRERIEADRGSATAGAMSAASTDGDERKGSNSGKSSKYRASVEGNSIAPNDGQGVAAAPSYNADAMAWLPISTRSKLLSLGVGKPWWTSGTGIVDGGEVKNDPSDDDDTSELKAKYVHWSQSEQCREFCDILIRLEARLEVALVQAACTLASAFRQRVDLVIALGSTSEAEAAFQQMQAVGFLLQWESLLSTHGKELGMVADYVGAVKALSLFALRIVPVPRGNAAISGAADASTPRKAAGLVPLSERENEVRKSAIAGGNTWLRLVPLSDAQRHQECCRLETDSNAQHTQDEDEAGAKLPAGGGEPKQVWAQIVRYVIELHVPGVVFADRDACAPSEAHDAFRSKATRAGTEPHGKAARVLGDTEPYGKAARVLGKAATRSASDIMALGSMLRGAGLTADRTHLLKTYSDCFVASEAVDWMLANVESCKTRELATDLGNQMVSSGIIRHVTSAHEEFEDKHLYYAFCGVDDGAGGSVRNGVHRPTLALHGDCAADSDTDQPTAPTPAADTEPVIFCAAGRRFRLQRRKKIALPRALARGQLIQATHAAFTQGINEFQSVANRTGNKAAIAVQIDANVEALRNLERFYARYRAYRQQRSLQEAIAISSVPGSAASRFSESMAGGECDLLTSERSRHAPERMQSPRTSLSEPRRTTPCVPLQTLDNELQEIRRRVLVAKGKAATGPSLRSGGGRKREGAEILQLVGHFARAIGGARIIMCKSAKDRTSMSTTNDHVKLLGRYHGVPESEWVAMRDIFRSHGVRRENSLKNVGKRAYAFNAFQRKMLPREYRPPANTMAWFIQR